MPTTRRGSRYKLPGPGGQEGDPEPDYVAHAFVFVGSVVICRVASTKETTPIGRISDVVRPERGTDFGA